MARASGKDDQDGGQFGRDARQHLRTADQASMKRTAMDVRPGQMRLPVADALTPGEVNHFARMATAVQRNAHLNTEPQNPKLQARAAGNMGKVAGETAKKGKAELAGAFARQAAHHGKRALGQDEVNAADADGGHGEHGEHEEPSHYESAMSRKTGASVGQLRKEQSEAEKTGYMKRVSPGTLRPSGRPKP